MREHNEYERQRDAEWEREQQRLRRGTFMENLMPLLQWVLGAGIFATVGWMIFTAIQSLGE